MCLSSAILYWAYLGQDTYKHSTNVYGIVPNSCNYHSFKFSVGQGEATKYLFQPRILSVLQDRGLSSSSTKTSSKLHIISKP